MAITELQGVGDVAMSVGGRRMSIAILLPDFRGGGVERIRLVLAREFAREGHDVEFVVLQERGELLEAAKAEFQVHTLSVTRFRKVLPPLVRYLRQRRPNTLLAAMWPLTGIASLAVRRAGYNVRLVASEHVDFRITPSLKSWEKLVLRHFGKVLYKSCSRVVGVSQGVADSLIAVAGLEPERIQVIHNPVRPFLAETIPEMDRVVLSNWLRGSPRLIAVGTLKRQKRFDLLIKAFAQVREHHDAQLLVLGEGSLRPELERLAVELGVDRAVTMPGFRDNPGAFLQHADIFALSSDWEGFGNVIVEAMSLGVPVVTTDCLSGPREILADGRFGILVKPGDWVALANGIERMIEEPHDADSLRSRANEFRPEKQALEYLRCLFGDRE